MSSGSRNAADSGRQVARGAALCAAALLVVWLLPRHAWQSATMGAAVCAPDRGRVTPVKRIEGPVEVALAEAEAQWGVRFVGYDLEGLTCTIPAGDYTLPELLDRFAAQTGLSWSEAAGGQIVLTRKDLRARVARAVETSTPWKARKNLALTGARFLDRLPEDVKTRLRDGHRVGTWRLSEETLWRLMPLILGQATDGAPPPVDQAHSWVSRYAHAELEVRFEPDVLVYRGERGDPKGRYDATYRLVPMPLWGQAVRPRYEPGPEDLPTGGDQ